MTRGRRGVGEAVSSSDLLTCSKRARHAASETSVLSLRSVPRSGVEMASRVRQEWEESGRCRETTDTTRPTRHGRPDVHSVFRVGCGVLKTTTRHSRPNVHRALRVGRGVQKNTTRNGRPNAFEVCFVGGAALSRCASARKSGAAWSAPAPPAPPPPVADWCCEPESAQTCRRHDGSYTSGVVERQGDRCATPSLHAAGSGPDLPSPRWRLHYSSRGNRAKETAAPRAPSRSLRSSRVSRDPDRPTNRPTDRPA